MYGRRAGPGCDLHQRFERKVRLLKVGGPESRRNGCHTHMGCGPIGIRVRRDSLDSEHLSGPDDAYGDLAAVGDQYPHVHYIR